MENSKNVVSANNSENSLEPKQVTDMEITNKNLPRPTAEVTSEYERVENELRGLDPSWSDEEANAYIGKEFELQTSYDWSNVEFTDPVTGKKGLKDVKGSIVIPALYDGFPRPGFYTYFEEPIIAQCGGKYGFMSHTDSGEIMFDFVYDSVDAALVGQWETYHVTDDSDDDFDVDFDVDIEDPPLPYW
jgi:hypothetical protein